MNACSIGWYDFLVRRRVAISGILFVAVLSSGIAIGVQPREFTTGRHDVLSLIGTGLLLIGLAVRSWAAGTLIKNRELTVVGPYRLVRNPLYLGSFLMIVGTCLLTNNALALLLIVSPLLAIYSLSICSEERRLAQRFGAAWQEYAATTHRFVPKFAKVEFSDWRFRQWIKNREYAAVAATTMALVVVEIWENIR
jgi:protein-S-isoprenylcysteine O-methyltransferase Ste14